MKWMRFRRDGVEGFGVLDDRGDGTGEHGSIAVHAGDMFDAPRATGERLDAAGLEWLAPCRPGKIIGLWNNFRAAAEKSGWAAPAEPLYFLKATSSLIGHGAAIPAPRGYDGRVAYEGELAVVIGRRARGIGAAEAAATSSATAARTTSRRWNCCSATRHFRNGRAPRASMASARSGR